MLALFEYPLFAVTVVTFGLTLILSARTWSTDIAAPDSRPPGFVGVLARTITRGQLQRPALVPTLITLAALVAAWACRDHGTPAHDVPALQSLSSAYAGAMLTIFTLLAGLTAGFTFTVIGTMGSTFTPLLSDPAIRAPRFWWFLAFSMAGMAASVFLLLLPPKSVLELAVTMVCLTGSLITLTGYLRGVALDANPATLLRRLTDNDVPPAGFRTFARGRPVQIGLAVVRAALQRRDGPIAAAATYEVVRACAHFQHAMMRKPVTELSDPRYTWGSEFIAEVQSEFRHWIDELDDNPAAPASAYDAAGRLLAYPLVWESTLTARLSHAGPQSAAGGQRDAEEDLEQPLHALLVTSAANADHPSAPVALRKMTMKSSALSGALHTILDAQTALDDEAERSPAFADVRAVVETELARAAMRLALEHARQLEEIAPTDRYEQRLVQTTQQALAEQAAAAIAQGGEPTVMAAVQALRAVAPGKNAASVFVAGVLAALRHDPDTDAVVPSGEAIPAGENTV